jgi:L,D-transpeptidase YbiS
MNRMVVRVATQTAELWDDDQLLGTYTISTATNGLGCVPKSYCTPPGRLRVAVKVGDDMPAGTVFKSRIPTGEVWTASPENPLSQSTDDLILTRILWLEGIEEANANTLSRTIYIHGTNQEHLLGKPASHGCIRMSNADVMEVYELLLEGSEVEVIAED